MTLTAPATTAVPIFSPGTPTAKSEKPSPLKSAQEVLSNLRSSRISQERQTRILASRLCRAGIVTSELSASNTSRAAYLLPVGRKENRILAPGRGAWLRGLFFRCMRHRLGYNAFCFLGLNPREGPSGPHRFHARIGGIAW